MYTKFRPWKQAKSPRSTGPTNEFACTQDEDVAARETLASPNLRFINTAHPSEAISVTMIGTIRSHVARSLHATRRQSKIQASQAPLHSDPRQGAPDSISNTESRLVDCASKVGTIDDASQQPGPQMIDAKIPNPAIFLIPARRNPFNRLTRPLNDIECFLIDYYKLVIIPERFSSVDNEASKMLSLWLPFVLSDSGLLCAILLVTCECLMLLEPHRDHRSPYAIMAVKYKGACIRSIMSALSTEGTLVSDFTLAKTMVMCSYELKFGDNNNARCHATAIEKMIELKGDMRNISTQAYIEEIIARFRDLMVKPLIGIKNSE